VIDAPAVFGRFQPWEGVVEPGWTRNWLGVRTRAEIQTQSGASAEPTFVRFERPAVSEDFFEWLDVLESVAEAGVRYTIVELGAGWGRWLANAAAAVRQLDRAKPFLLVGVEAEPTHFAWLRRHLIDNDIDPNDHVLLRAAVAARDGRVRFRVGDAAAWYGQSIDRDDPAARESGPVSRLIRWARNSAANAAARGPGARRLRRVRAVSLTTVLEPFHAVDLLDADVQGAEADIFEPAGAVLNAKVRRVHVGTHGAEVEGRLRRFFSDLGWESRFDYAGGGVRETPWGPVQFEDGAQSWVNPTTRVPA
jgi:FkbM family methyltransferase